MMHIFRRMLLMLLMGGLCIWGAEVVKCEVLTAHYGSEDLRGICEQYMKVGAMDQLKVLDYRKYGYARVYTCNKDLGCELLLLWDWTSDCWQVEYWDAVWSDQGSADGLIWPYFR